MKNNQKHGILDVKNLVMSKVVAIIMSVFSGQGNNLPSGKYCYLNILSKKWEKGNASLVSDPMQKLGGRERSKVPFLSKNNATRLTHVRRKRNYSNYCRFVYSKKCIIIFSILLRNFQSIIL